MKQRFFLALCLLTAACSNTSNNNSTIDSLNRGNSERPNTSGMKGAIPMNSVPQQPDTSSGLKDVQGNNGTNTTNGVNGATRPNGGSSRERQ
jgi:hypothetical protein